MAHSSHDVIDGRAASLGRGIVLTAVLVIGAVVGVLLVIPWLALRMERNASSSSASSNPFQVLEEVFAPSARRANVVQEEQTQRRATAPAPGDD